MLTVLLRFNAVLSGNVIKVDSVSSVLFVTFRQFLPLLGGSLLPVLYEVLPEV